VNLAVIAREEKFLIRIFVARSGKAENMRLGEGPVLLTSSSQALIETSHQRL
jgi:hypothetical protein